jgi:outer membrane protein TolC
MIAAALTLLRTVDEQKAIDKALANRLELREAELDYELTGIELDRARRIREVSGKISAYYDITGVSTLEHGSTTRLFNSSFRNFADRPPNRGITFSLNCPIFDWGRGKERVQQQMANLRDAELQMENQRNEIIRQVRDIVRRVEEAGGRLAIHEQNQQLAERSYRISRLRFENGAITSQDLALAQERLAGSQLNYLEAYISYQLAVAELKQQTLWDFGTDSKYQVEERYSIKGEQ